MTDLSEQIRSYFDATTENLDVQALMTRSSGAQGLTAGPTRKDPVMNIDLEPRRDTDGERASSRSRTYVLVGAVAAAVLLVVAAIVAVVALRDTETLEPAEPVTTTSPVATTTPAAPEDAGPSPADVMASYEQAVNDRDIDAMMALYAPDAVVEGDPNSADTLTGTDEIRLAEQTKLNRMSSREGQVYWVTGIEIDGNVVRSGHVYYGSPTGCFAGTGDRITIDDGLITNWTWGTHTKNCVRDVIDEVDRAVNSRSTSILASLLDAGVELVGHPAGDASGAEDVLAVLAGEYEAAGDDVELDVRNFEVADPSLTFDYVRTAGADCTAVLGNRIVSEGGRIILWEWGTDIDECPTGFVED